MLFRSTGHDGDLPSAAAEQIMTAAHRLRLEAREAAQAALLRLYAEPAQALVERLRTYWQSARLARKVERTKRQRPEPQARRTMH